MDSLWQMIVEGVHLLIRFFDFLFGPFNSLGPGAAIFAIAFVSVVTAKCLTRICKTKRYLELKKEFQYWYNLRQEALQCKDPEKAKALAKNIDQAELNRVYYDYFFEGLMIGLVARVLPILTFMGYVNETYKQENLRRLFGRDFIFRLKGLAGEAIPVGAVFWFVISILIIYSGWAITAKIYSRHRGGS